MCNFFPLLPKHHRKPWFSRVFTSTKSGLPRWRVSSGLPTPKTQGKQMGVSWNRGTPKSSIFMGFSFNVWSLLVRCQIFKKNSGPPNGQWWYTLLCDFFSCGIFSAHFLKIFYYFYIAIITIQNNALCFFWISWFDKIFIFSRMRRKGSRFILEVWG